MNASTESPVELVTFKDGTRIVFQGLVSAAQGADAPTIQIAGIEIDADVLVEQVLALGAEALGEAGEGEDADASGTIDLGGGNEITFVDIEQIVYTGVA